MPLLDRRDIQGNILRGYRLPFGAHLFLEITDDAAARDFIRGLQVTPDETPAKPTSALNIAFTFAGLSRLRPELELELGSRFTAFAKGMRARAVQTGDKSEDDKSEDDKSNYADWDASHIWLAFLDRNEAVLETRLEAVRATLQGVREVREERTAAIVAQHGNAPVWLEHFGFRDDISNPEVEGAEDRDKLGPGTGRRDTPGGAWLPIRTGEFLLGYENDKGDPIPDGELGNFLKNGTFVVVRKLEQHVHKFRAYLAHAGQQYQIDPEALAEKIVGRRTDGTPLVAAGADLNQFDYANDAEGRRCPLSAHVRRVHPRDADNGAGTSGRHRLIRRGMPYGQPLPDDAPAFADLQAAEAADTEERRGLLFVGMNASIEDQFEFIQHDWINHASRSAMDDWDPLVGAHVHNGAMIIPRPGLPLYLVDLPRFVRVRGGQYFFMPGMSALRSLCE